MIITTDKHLHDFEFWCGGKQRADKLTVEQLNSIELQLEELYPDGMTDTQVNDIFWFEEDFIAQLVGYESWEALREDEEV